MKIIIKNSSKFFLYGLASILFLNGCGLDRLMLDESNLKKVASYYYRPGEKSRLSSYNEYHFLSSNSKTQISLDDWNKSRGEDNTNYTTAVSILGEKKAEGNTYAIVSITFEIPNKDGKKYKEVASRTWTLENNKWRKLNFLKTEEKIKRSFQEGDYANTKTEAEEFLTFDPFSIEAYNYLGGAVYRIGESNQAGRSINDILRAMLAINHDDTLVLSAAVRFSDTPSIAESYLRNSKGPFNIPALFLIMLNQLKIIL